MKPGREIDTLIAKHVFGHEVKAGSKTIWERTDSGDRPLRPYSKEIQFAWEVAEKMNISLLPIENGQWFAMVGQRWSSPADFMKYLKDAQFMNAGAAVGDSAALTICLAALRATEKRLSTEQGNTESEAKPVFVSAQKAKVEAG
jgi:hypothetical protein